MPTAKWWWRCAAAIFGKAWRALWKSGRRGLRGGEGKRCCEPQPGFAQQGFAGHHASPFGHHVAAPREARRAKRGGARRDRTADLVIANDALSQLSYGPIAAVSVTESGRQSAPFTVCPKVKSRTVKVPFSAPTAGNFSCLQRDEPISSRI